MNPGADFAPFFYKSGEIVPYNSIRKISILRNDIDTKRAVAYNLNIYISALILYI